MAKVKKTTAMHEQTGEVRKVIIKNKIMYFDLGCALIEAKDPLWKEQSNNTMLQFWLVVAAFMIVIIGLTAIGAYNVPL